MHHYFRLSSVVVAGIITAGLLLELLSIPSTELFYPYNVLFLIFLIIVAIAAKLFLSQTYFFKWFSSIQNSIVAIVAFVTLSLILAIVPQQAGVLSVKWPHLGKLLHTHYFQWTYLYLVLTLAFVVARRTNAGLNFRNVAFLLNHAGLWITLVGGGLGSFDTIKADMLVKHNSPVWYAYTSQNEYIELPFALELKDFDVEFYLPKLQFVQVKDFKTNDYKILKQWELDTIHEIRYKDMRIKVKKYLPYTWWWNDSMLSIKTPGYVGSADVCIATDTSKICGWISYSSIMQKGRFLQIDHEHYLFLSDPLPKVFKSNVEIYTQQGQIFETDILVNKPLLIAGWHVYQKDYHKELKDFSDYSIFEVVYDPWLWVVYLGIIMLMIGAVLLIFIKN